MCSAVVSMAIVSAAGAYARYSFRVAEQPLTGASIAAWLASWVFVPAVALAGALLLFLFPTGHLPSRRCRLALWVVVAVAATTAVVYAFRPGSLALERSVDNPFGMDGGVRVNLESA